MNTQTILRLAPILGFTSAFFSSGVAFSASYLAFPPLYTTPSKHSLPIFKYIYEVGATVAVPLAAISTLSFAAASYLSKSSGAGGAMWQSPRARFAIAGLTIFAWIPWTLIVMVPSINRLLEAERDDRVREKMGEQEIVKGLKAWKWQNLTRGGFAFAAGVVGVTAFAL